MASTSMSSASSSSSSPSVPPAVLSLVRQRYEWDCGLACAEMVLRAAGAPSSVSSFESLSGDITDKSVWTADVALALARRGLGQGLLYHTTLAGVNPAHRQLAFYAEGIDKDTRRMPAVFEEAESLGVVVREERLPLERILSSLSSLPSPSSVFIVLVDLRFLACTRCPVPPSLLHHNYAGHYIVVSGYDPGRKELLYLDPVTVSARCAMSVEDFERARSSTGTDDDVLELHLPLALALTDDAAQRWAARPSLVEAAAAEAEMSDGTRVAGGDGAGGAPARPPP